MLATRRRPTGALLCDHDVHTVFTRFTVIVVTTPAAQRPAALMQQPCEHVGRVAHLSFLVVGGPSGDSDSDSKSMKPARPAFCCTHSRSRALRTRYFAARSGART